MLGKVLVLSASAGAGHVRAAQALERALTDSGAARDVRHVDALDHTTTEMDEYMAAADLMVGKPGGLTTSEALARGLVMVIVNPIPGQEKRNADHLLEQGVAIRCNNLPVLAYKIDRLLDDPARLAAMRASIERLARPHAARTAVERLLQLDGVAPSAGWRWRRTAVPALRGRRAVGSADVRRDRGMRTVTGLGEPNAWITARSDDGIPY